MVNRGKIAERKRTKDQKNKPVRLEIIFKTKAKTLRVSRFTKLIIDENKVISKKKFKVKWVHGRK